MKKPIVIDMNVRTKVLANPFSKLGKDAAKKSKKFDAIFSPPFHRHTELISFLKTL
jgi:hypothetical protein